jgi:alkaline phosphatase D
MSSERSWNGPLTRRRLLAGSAGAATAVCLGARAPWSYAVPPRFASDPFSLGVASGEPAPRGVVLWTRLAPDPFSLDGGVPAGDLPVRWEVARDEGFRRVVRRGEARAVAQLAHAVHVEVDGLAPDTWYWYRFQAGGERSAVGRTRTLPRRGARPRATAFAVASCQRFEHGYFTAHRHLARQDLDFVVHLGDYLYENPIAPTAGPRALGLPDELRPAATDLAGYRLRHALYKTDPDLQAAHAAFPWLTILDNHDAVWDGDEADPRDNLARRAAAYQAWFEHMPWRARQRPAGPSMPIHRRLAWGDLLELQLLDTRQFKDDEDVCGAPPPNLGPRCPAVLDPARTMLGEAQERWLLDGLERSRGRWNAIAQTILMAEFDFTPGPERSYYLSGWDGYPAQRRRLLDHLARTRVANPVILTGDWHTSWVNDVKADPADPGSQTLATELLATSISSDTGFTSSRSQPAVTENPVVKYYNDRNGYTRCAVTREQWRADFVDVLDTDVPASPTSVSASWVIESGTPGALPA